MDIEGDLTVQLILGQPFLRVARTRIDVKNEDMFFKFKQGRTALSDSSG